MILTPSIDQQQTVEAHLYPASMPLLYLLDPESESKQIFPLLF